MKYMHECNKTNDSHAECNKRMEFMETQINFLHEQCNFKTKLIKSLLENLFNHENHQTTQSTFNYSKLTIKTLAQGVKYVQSQ